MGMGWGTNVLCVRGLWDASTGCIQLKNVFVEPRPVGLMDEKSMFWSQLFSVRGHENSNKGWRQILDILSLTRTKSDRPHHRIPLQQPTLWTLRLSLLMRCFRSEASRSPRIPTRRSSAELARLLRRWYAWAS
ncbi:hypothetical protein JAAARDRAFT_41126 [Jaapia argillacea MUCL 33604]|uniref:Uncharacterized protein n=1 Tax=Jaapia argillacea MUCL 33604 TaxID=933084 RepID=A0A067P9R6_9AGAM|nr:hypothetical protein JAAARDRAFT_41126 [Jaapia argillacea MUCL 33604]